MSKVAIILVLLLLGFGVTAASDNSWDNRKLQHNAKRIAEKAKSYELIVEEIVAHEHGLLFKIRAEFISNHPDPNIPPGVELYRLVYVYFDVSHQHFEALKQLNKGTKITVSSTELDQPFSQKGILTDFLTFTQASRSVRETHREEMILCGCTKTHNSVPPRSFSP